MAGARGFRPEIVDLTLAPPDRRANPAIAPVRITGPDLD